MRLATGTPEIALVTDRRRLAAAWGRPSGDAVALLLSQVEAAAHAGVPLAIVREPDLDARALLAIVRELLARVRPAAMRIVVNDRLDVALAAGAQGVHLRGRSFPAADARRLAPPGFLIGRSVHDERAAADAGPVDYLVAGTVFPTASKPAGHALLGLDGLGRLAGVARAPVLGIGGIATEAQVRQVLAAGAAGVAVVGALQGAGSHGELARAVQNCAYRLRSVFDMPGGLS